MTLTSFDVIVPSVGEPALTTLLSSINKSSLIPSNVFIVLRSSDSFLLDSSLYSFPISIYHSSIHGQVAQRQYGFSLATSPVVVQLDADSVVDYNFFAILLGEFLYLESYYGSKVALAPSFIDSNDFRMFSTDSFFLQSLRCILSFLGLLYRSSNLSRYGQNFPLNLTFNRLDHSPLTFRSDWLPGGCVVHRRDNLITSNYYKFPGKAFAEDLFHSFLLSRSSTKLFVTYKASLTTEAHPRVVKPKDIVHFSVIYVRTSLRFCRLTGCPSVFSLLSLLPYFKALLVYPFTVFFKLIR